MKSLLNELRAARKAYGATMTNDQCAALINDVLFAHGEGEYALCADRGGNFARLHNGVKVEVDGIVESKTRTFVDVLKDAGGKSEPAWQVHTIGELSPRGNYYGPHTGPLVAPIAPKVDKPPVVVPTPVPPPAPTCECSGRMAALEARIVLLERRPHTSSAAVEERLGLLERVTYRITGAANRYLRLGIERES